jgi:hypothetical protein
MGPGLHNAFRRLQELLWRVRDLAQSSAALQRGRELLAALPARWSSRSTLLAAAAALGLLVILGAWRWGQAREAEVALRAAGQSLLPAYVLVCHQCGRRSGHAARPTPADPRRPEAFACPACGRTTAAVYRRGGQSVPPGGWSGATPAAANPETGP